MAFATVYEYEVYDPATRRWSRGSGMATLEAIERRGGVALRETGMRVAAERVDERGWLRPAAPSAKPDRAQG